MLNNQILQIWSKSGVVADTFFDIRIPENVRRLTVLYAFDLTAGAGPALSLSLDFQGNLLAMTMAAVGPVAVDTDGVLTVDFPPPVIRANIDWGAATWDIEIAILVALDE